MSKGNRIEKNGQLIRKYFASHMDYSQESKIFEKLKGTGLAPEVTLQYDGLIERKYVEGPTFAELFEKYADDPRKQAGLFEAFCDWYTRFREVTNLLLGNVDPSKFILTDDGFVYIDFEHCRPGFAESDLAHLVKWMGTSGTRINVSGAEAAKLFICVCSSKLKLNPDRLEKALKSECEDCGSEVGDMIRFMTSAAVVVCRSTSEADISAATAAFASAPERYLCVLPGQTASCPGFEVVTGTEDECISRLVHLTAQPNLMVLFTGPECDPEKPLYVSIENIREFLPIPSDVDVMVFLSGVSGTLAFNNFFD